MGSKVQFKKRTRTDDIFVHCSATKPGMDIGLREIRQWHRERGFLDVGYHFIIRRDGTVEEGRPVDVVGSHVQGHNHNSVGICLVGGIDAKGNYEANFTASQMHSLTVTLGRVKALYKGVTIRAHHDVAPKACPSFNLQRWLKTGELVSSDRG